MARTIIAEFRDKRAPAAEWTIKNPILEAGEHGFEEDTGKFKIGNGMIRWNGLPYFVPASGTTPEDLNAHIESETPHPVYDDGPDLTLLYENAKV